MITIATVIPGLGDSTKAITLELGGSGFLAGVVVSLISPTYPPIVYPLSGVVLLSNTTLRATIGANSVPVGIYDVKVDNGSRDTFVLPQSYRSAPLLPVDPFSLQTFDNLMARVMGNVNPSSNPTKYDVRVGQVPWDLTAPMMSVVSDIWRNLWQVMLQGFSQYTSGSLLELRAEEHGVIKKGTSQASGVMQITAPVGAQIPIGMTFATVATAQNPSGIKTFTSTEILPKIQVAPIAGTATSADSISLTDSGKAWTVNQWLNTYIWIRLGTGAGQVRKIQSNTATTILPYTPWSTGQIPDATSQYTLFSGVDILADVGGFAGNVVAGAISRVTSNNPFITTVTNPIGLSLGTDVESNANLLSRFLLTVRSPSAGGNVYDYQNWAKATPGVNLGSVSVIPVWSGAGTVKVVIINSDNTIPNASVVSAVQSYIDPTPGLGLGKAPIGASVTVQAATAVPIDASVAVTVTPGVNVGTVRAQVQASIQNYLNNISVGSNVLLTQVQNAIINSTVDSNGNYIHNIGVQDFDFLSAGHGIKKTSSGTWTTANIAILGTEKPISGTITVS